MSEQLQLRFKQPTNEHERKALGLYVILDRDFVDFLDMLPEASDETLRWLFLMLTTPYEKHTDHDRQINALGSGPVGRELERRGFDLEKVKEHASAS